MKSPGRQTMKPLYTESPRRVSGYETPIAGHARLMYPAERAHRYYGDEDDDDDDDDDEDGPRPEVRCYFLKVISMLIILGCTLIVIVETSHYLLTKYFSDSKDV